MTSIKDLPHLLHLLDDADPQVRPAVESAFKDYDGDISDDVAALGIRMSDEVKNYLSGLLVHGRRRRLRDEWQVPTGGGRELCDDWERFEDLLGVLADFFHDGVDLRPSLPDELDLLADELREVNANPTADEMRKWLFAKKRYKGAAKQVDAVHHYDLCGVIESGEGNPTSLACLFMLLARRFQLNVEGCNYPGHFLARMDVDGKAFLVDCFHSGRKFEVAELLRKHPEISPYAKDAASHACPLGEILLRVVHELEHSYAAKNLDEDAALFRELRRSLDGVGEDAHAGDAKGEKGE
ncbi:transglutaminase family protein [Persicirhabdus sediminis]|uniref:Protein SirB1 N-terminal domain-containing protein n=1 Tax=Persicirhabdus sediminis TaxID=454144 RepID=A0A8J7MGQ3_9BACT|nr:transglutaminase family protein [Persicirhabdus sediminis]MBK1792577.1 hypothetical protein [Persicirhabdus sediminis]